MDKVALFRGRDIYSVLGVEQDAEINVIKSAYRRKALDCHPDKNKDDPNAVDKFHELQYILDILEDEEARNCYNQQFEQRDTSDKELTESEVRTNLVQDIKNNVLAAWAMRTAQRVAKDAIGEGRIFDKDVETFINKASSKFATKVHNHDKSLLRNRHNDQRKWNTHYTIGKQFAGPCISAKYGKQMVKEAEKSVVKKIKSDCQEYGEAFYAQSIQTEMVKAMKEIKTPLKTQKLLSKDMLNLHKISKQTLEEIIEKENLTKPAIWNLKNYTVTLHCEGIRTIAKDMAKTFLYSCEKQLLNDLTKALRPNMYAEEEAEAEKKGKGDGKNVPGRTSSLDRRGDENQQKHGKRSNSSEDLRNKDNIPTSNQREDNKEASAREDPQVKRSHHRDESERNSHRSHDRNRWHSERVKSNRDNSETSKKHSEGDEKNKRHNSKMDERSRRSGSLKDVDRRDRSESQNTSNKDTGRTGWKESLLGSVFDRLLTAEKYNKVKLHK